MQRWSQRLEESRSRPLLLLLLLYCVPSILVCCCYCFGEPVPSLLLLLHSILLMRCDGFYSIHPATFSLSLSINNKTARSKTALTHTLLGTTHSLHTTLLQYTSLPPIFQFPPLPLSPPFPQTQLRRTHCSTINQPILNTQLLA